MGDNTKNIHISTPNVNFVNHIPSIVSLQFYVKRENSASYPIYSYKGQENSMKIPDEPDFN